MSPPITRRLLLSGAAATGVAAAPPKQRVLLTTPGGNMTLLIHLDRAPLSGADFLRYVDGGDYDGGRFFRVVRPDNDHGHPQIDVVQGGIRPGAKQGATVRHEPTSLTGLRHVDGAISLTRDAPGTGSGAEFFVCVGDQPALDFGGTRNPDRQGFAVFGQVTDGMAVVRRIWGMAAGGVSEDRYTVGQILTRPVPILSARRI